MDGLTILQPSSQSHRVALYLLVRQFLKIQFKIIDSINKRSNVSINQSVIFSAKYLCKNAHEKTFWLNYIDKIWVERLAEGRQIFEGKVSEARDYLI